MRVTSTPAEYLELGQEAISMERPLVLHVVPGRRRLQEREQPLELSRLVHVWQHPRVKHPGFSKLESKKVATQRLADLASGGIVRA